jgi:hypothetical protein
MEDYGFILAKKEEVKGMDLPDSTGLFRELYSNMEIEVKRNKQSETNYRQALEMSSEEKQISFLNRYFIFRKVLQVDVKKMTEVILKQNEFVERNGEENIAELEKTVAMQQAKESDESVVIEKVKGPKLVIKKKLLVKEPTNVVAQEPNKVAAPPMKLRIRVPTGNKP